MSKENVVKSKMTLTFQLNQISENEQNPLLTDAEFSVLDLEDSKNGQRLEEETVNEALPLIKDMPILARYYPVSEAGAEDDNFGDHEQIINVDRDGNEFVTTGTLPIGHFVTNGKYETVDGKENVVVANAVLYSDKYPNQVALLKSLLEQGIKINTSCEYYYMKSKAKLDENGIEVIGGNILFGGHTILGSNPDGQGGVIDGAYESSRVLSINAKEAGVKWNESLNAWVVDHTEDNPDSKLNNTKNVNSGDADNADIVNSISEEEKKGSKNMAYEKVLVIPENDIRVRLYNALKEHMTEEEFGSVEISANNVGDTSFVYQVNEGEEGKLRWYDVSTYENKEFVNVDGEMKLQYKTKKDVTTEYYDVYNSLNTAKEDLVKANNSLTAEKESLVLANHAKAQIDLALTEATGKAISLNERVVTLEGELEGFTEIKNQLEADRKEKALNVLSEEFKVKFNKANKETGLEKFETEEVQNMLKESVEDATKETETRSALNAMIIDLIPDVEVVINSTEVNATDESEDLEQSKNSKVKGKEDADSINLNHKDVNNLLGEGKKEDISEYID